MDKFFANLWLVVMIGFGLAIILIALPDYAIAPGVTSSGMATGVLQWLHVVFGIMWIGLLYYFNFVQTPVMPAIPAELKPGVSKHIAPAALFYFRWAAALTVLAGLVLAWSYHELIEVITFKEGYRLLSIGVYLGLIMAFNVWFIIWPNQKKALGIVTVTPEEKTKAARTAMLTSRINTMLSIPMLFCMVAQQNGGL